MDNAELDGVVVMILITCIISSIATDQAARNLKLQGEELAVNEKKPINDDEKILIPVNEPENIPVIVQTGIMMRNPVLNRGLICLNVVNEDDPTGTLQRQSNECLALAEKVCAGADVKVQTQSRLAVNFVNGVIHAFRENDASEILVGLHRRRTPSDSLLGQFAPGLINGLNRQITIVRYTISINTIRKIIVAVPERAQYETGFYRWVERLLRMSEEIGCRIDFHATEETSRLIRGYKNRYHANVRDEYSEFDDDVSLELLAQETGQENLFVLITARKGTISYEKRMSKMQFMLTKYFNDKNLMIIYPDQEGKVDEIANFSEPHGSIDHSSWMSQWFSKWISKIG